MKTLPLLVLVCLAGAAGSAFAESVLDLRATFPEVKPYSGPVTAAVTKPFSFPGQGRFRITVTYSPWYRPTNEMFKWRSTVPVDGRDFGAWVEFVPGATPLTSRGVPEPRADGGGLVIVSEITVRQAQPGMQAGIFPPVVRFRDGSFHQLPASASVVIESLVNDRVNAAAGDAESIWTVEEPDFEGGTWYGTWTRRGDSNVYDAFWRHSSKGEHRDVLEFRGMQGRRITFWRRGVNGTYSAEVGPDGRTITGGVGSWYPAGGTWKGVRGGGAPAAASPAPAPRSAFDPGRAWTVEEPDFQGGTWTGTWTRRGATNVYDAYWRHNSGREHRGTVEFRGIDGQRVTFFRHDVNGTYSGQIGSDGRSIRGGTTSWYPSGWTWNGSLVAP